MKRLRRNTLAYILALPLVYGTASLPQSAWAGGAEREPGAVVFVITLPISALGGNVDEAGEKLVVRPGAYTFSRCLGCFGGEH